MNGEAVARHRLEAVVSLREALLRASCALAAAVLALGFAVVLARHPLPLGLVALAGLALVGTLALALARYDAAVGLGIALLGVVAVDPAPPDLVFVVVIAVAAASGRFDLDRVPKPALMAIVVFAALNLVSAVEVIDPARAATFFSITLYLGVLALWLTGYVVSSRQARLIARGYVLAAVGVGPARFARAARRVSGRPPPGRGRRARALFQDPNVFGPFLIPAALIVIDELVRPRVLRAWPLAKSSASSRSSWACSTRSPEVRG